MEIALIGSLGAYLKTVEKQTQWKIKQESGDVTHHTKSLEEWLEDQETPQSSAQAVRNTEDKKLQGVYQKLYSGKKLSASEKAYLQEKDPIAYDKAKSIEVDRKDYAQALKRCRTKEDVQRLKMSYLSSSMSAVNTIRNHPNITDDKKLELIALENGKASALAKVAQEFVRRGYYEKLPTNAEMARTEEAMERESEIQPKEPARGEVSRTESTVPQTEDLPEKKEAPSSPSEERDRQAARKVKRSRAVAAYAQLGGAPEPDLLSIKSTTLDTQA